MSTDYYDLLGVPRDASGQDIKKAFRQIARECHPDVAGSDPAAEERFKKARNAYETLMDPVTRARYDRRGQRRSGGLGAGSGSFFDAFYRATGQTQPTEHRGPPQRGRPKRNDPANNLDLDDVLNIGDFGFGGRPGGRSPGPGGAGPRPRVHTEPVRGDDVHLVVDVPAFTAQRGGSVTAVYHRLQRAEAWRPGSGDEGLSQIEDIADIRIVPGTRDGMVLRERGLGHAGAHGGPYGDLVATVRVVGFAPPPRPEASPPPRSAPPPPARSAPPPGSANGSARNGAAAADEVQVQPMDISVVEALLGGRVDLDTPQGRVRLTIPPCTSGGTRMRLKGKGTPADGQPRDLYVEVRIRVPDQLDEPSRHLIEEFARLNP